MSKTKHTPGPWVLSPDQDYLIETKNQLSICRYHVSEVTQAEDLANARLIAAAPDMYTALGLILNDDRLMNAMSREQARAILDAAAKAVPSED